MITLSENANPNYTAKIVTLERFENHPDADSLKFALIGALKVIVSIDAQEGETYVYFPIESQISHKFLSETNSYSSAAMNADGKTKRFFGKNGRVRAVKLRGHVSNGYLAPVESLVDVYGPLNFQMDQDFDTVNGELLCKKYEVPIKSSQNTSQGKKPKISRLVDGQVRLHVDTTNLRREPGAIKPESNISITYKTHGTSFWAGNLLVKEKKGWLEKFNSFFYNNDKEVYDIVYGSRRVVKNESETMNKEHYYGEDLWGHIAESVGGIIPAGYTLYGECIGYTPGGGEIQKDYDYKCSPGTYKLQIYRVTITNVDGEVIDLSQNQIEEFCLDRGLDPVAKIFSGKARDLYPDLDTENHWSEEFVKRLEKDYNEKDCYMCANSVPEEGIVVRVESLNGFNPYKLKSIRFLEYETKQLDEGQSDLESSQ